MTVTVKDLFLYDANFDPAKIRRLTGKTNYKKTDTVNLSRLAALNDKDLSVFVAKKEGKSFLSSVQDDNMKTQIADASGIKTGNNQTSNIPAYMPMDKSVFDYQRNGIGGNHG